MITDISALSGLTRLNQVLLAHNSISDISAVGGLMGLRLLYLDNNAALTAIQPLLDNTGVGAGDFVFLRFTNVSCTDVVAVRAKGVTVGSACP